MLGARLKHPGTPFTITYRETATFPLSSGPRAHYGHLARDPVQITSPAANSDHAIVAGFAALIHSNVVAARVHVRVLGCSGV